MIISILICKFAANLNIPLTNTVMKIFKFVIGIAVVLMTGCVFDLEKHRLQLYPNLKNDAYQ